MRVTTYRGRCFDTTCTYAHSWCRLGGASNIALVNVAGCSIRVLYSVEFFRFIRIAALVAASVIVLVRKLESRFSAAIIITTVASAATTASTSRLSWNLHIAYGAASCGEGLGTLLLNLFDLCSPRG